MRREAGILSVVLLGYLSRSPAQPQAKLPPPANIQVEFKRDVKPILQANCYSCHGPSQQLSGLRLDQSVPALRGGDSGKVILAGNSAESKMILRLAGASAGLQMPPTGALSGEDIGILRAWIDQGAKWPEAIVEEAVPQEEPPDPKGEPLFRAIRKTDGAAVKAILRKDKSLVNVKGVGGSTPLMQATLHAGEDLMRLLLDRGANPNTRSAVGATALMWVAGDAGKARLLLSRGADVNIKSTDGRTALMAAAWQPGAASVVRLLLEKGADANAKDIQGAFALTLAAAAADLETMKLLLAHGADVNARTSGGGTPLMAAARAGCVTCVELLVARGADVKAVTKRGGTALSAVASSREPAMIKVLLEKGCAVNTRDDRGHTPLMLAAYSDFLDVETVRALLAKGADVNARSEESETALSLAKQKGNTPVVELLLKAGATER